MELIDREKIEWYGCNFETPKCESENRKCSECSHAECSHAQVMQLPSIKMSDNATNGDMIKAMFPDAEVTEIRGHFDKKTLLGYRTWLGGRSQDFLADWWNAPYRR